MNQKDYKSVLQTMRTSDGTLFPVPITLPVNKKYAIGQKVVLLDTFRNPLALITIDDIYKWDPVEYAQKVIGTNDDTHNLVRELKEWGAYNISGELQALALPGHRDFTHLRLSPKETRSKLTKIGNKNVVAFQTRNPLHRAHEELTKRAALKINGTLLLHPVVGITKPGDVDQVTRVRCYTTLLDNYYGETATLLGLLPLAMRMAGPREALWHAIIRRNYGANYFIVGRDHAGPGNNSKGEPFYQPYEAQQLVKRYEEELGISVITFNEMVYLADKNTYVEAHEVPNGMRTVSLSGTQVREDYLAKGRPLPKWFTRPEVAAILAKAYSPSINQGFCLWFTGLSGAGKSTIAQMVESALHELGLRTTMLDGDVVRNNLSKGLGFSKEDRETNIARVGYVASQIVYHHGIAICALISPYEEARENVRGLFEKNKFIEIYVSTPIEVCKKRDSKGYYAKSHQGKMTGLTGIDDIYEPPEHPDIVIDTSQLSIEACAQVVIQKLRHEKMIDI